MATLTSIINNIIQKVNNLTSSKVSKVTSTDNAVVRFNGTTGEIQDSSVVIDDNGNLNITGTGARITGDFSNGSWSNRLSIQNSTSNTFTSVQVLPNGTATDTSFRVFNSSNPNNSSFNELTCTATDTRIVSGTKGTGVALPLAIYTNGAERMRVTAAGNLLVGTSTDNGVDKLQINGSVKAGTFNGFGGSGLKNYIINGDFRVNQYERLPLNVTESSGTCIDNWRYANTGTGTLTLSMDTITYGNRVYKALKGITTAIMQDASTIYSHYTNIEDKNCFNLRNKPFTISFLCEVNYAGNYSLNIRKTNDDGSITTSYVKLVSLVAGVNKVEVNVPADLNYISGNSSNGRGLTICFGINGGTVSTNTEEGWQSGNFAGNANTFKWWKIVGAYIKMTNFQLEEGSVATPFEQRPYGLELSLCQRYYEKIDSNRCNIPVYGTGTGFIGSVKYKVQKRTVPTISLGTASHWRTIIIYTGVALSTLNVQETTAYGFDVNGTSSGGNISAGYAGKIQVSDGYTDNGTDGIFVSAEL